MSRIIDLIESVKDSKVLFVGDKIIDEYQYVSPMGMASKENMLAAKAQHIERFYGGVEIFSRGGIVRKTRFVNETYLRKMFEVHYLDQDYLDCRPELNGFDTVVVTDFGHGAVTKAMVAELSNQGSFFAVSAQTNSANYGYNLITKYPKADYIVIDEPEARLAAHDRESPIEEVIIKLALGRCSTMIVTHGCYEATGWREHEGFAKCPAFTEKIVDTMGAGDAFFAVTALMAKHGRLEDLLLIGNAAGALKTQIVGHRESVTKDKLIRFLNESGRIN